MKTTISSEREYFEENINRYIEWRHDLHAHPETAFEEFRTARLVAERLKSFGLQVTEGLARTGVVGVLPATVSTTRRVGLRADLDALPMTEEAVELPHCSVHNGKMHACGHDGHTVMLLAAAEYLSLHPFEYTEVIFIFQPAEENVAGGKVMVDEGLFDQFPVDEVFGLHNLPGQQFGHFAARIGPQMASADMFRATLIGKGGHAAWPHESDDVILAAAMLTVQWHTIVSRSVDPLDAAVLSITQVHGGESDNVLPSSVSLRGTVRALQESTRHHIEEQMEKVSRSLAHMKGLELEWSYERRYTATLNTPDQTSLAWRCAERVQGPERVDQTPLPLMGSEDFGWMLRARPGCYILLGAGDSPMLHHPRYDFNDELIPIGAHYWVEIARGE